jgi:hypothetical protein
LIPLFVLALLIVIGSLARMAGGGDAAPVVTFCIGLPLVLLLAGARTPLNPFAVLIMLAVTVAAAIAAVAALWLAGLLATGALVAILTVLGAMAWRRELILKTRAERGYCPRCGYDVRATPDRCPECGELTPSETARLRRVRDEIAAARAGHKPPPVPVGSDNAQPAADSDVKSPPQNL